MADDDGFEEAFKDFGKDPTPVNPAEPPKAPVEPPATPPATPPVEPPKTEEPKPADKPKEEEKKDEQAKPEEKPEEKTQDQKTEPGEKPPEKPSELPEKSEAPKPVTKDDIKEVVSDLLNTERSSGKELETTTNEILEKFYPDGLSNVLVDEKSGKELKTPADVVEASGGEMSTDEATRWLLNEQYKLDKKVSEIKADAQKVAELNINFKRDAVTALQKYEPLFKAYPQLQEKVYEKLKKQVKFDEENGIILAAPDVMEFYNDWLEPYQQAFEFATKQSATKTTTPTTPAAPEPPKPGAEDRMDEPGDGGASEINDPEDFAQQVKKELSKGA